jgi:hypothetical protein
MRKIILTIVFLFGLITLFAQTNISPLTGRNIYDNSFADLPRADSGIRIMFYNVENLFDPFDDSLKHDDEYTPLGFRGWSYSKFLNKVNSISRVIINVGGWEPPGIIGLCEIENSFALKKLIYNSSLRKFNYQCIHHESPDKRGIDVALLYRKEKFECLYDFPISIRFPFDTSSRTRDILYVKGLINHSDTLHLFVNHWPSRFGGYLNTKPKREYVASVLRKRVDSILSFAPQSSIIIMGDFNDDPEERSLSEVLNARPPGKQDSVNSLVNLMYNTHLEGKEGTHKHQEEWGILDQIIVSSRLLHKASKINIVDHKAVIFSPAFLLTKDLKYLGYKTLRTYHGAQYQGGYSDHLPVYLDLDFR